MPTINVWELVAILIFVLIVLSGARLTAFRRGRKRFVRTVREPIRTETQSPAPATGVPSTPETAPPVLADVVDNTCPSCNTINPTGQLFCGQCGVRLTRAA